MKAIVLVGGFGTRIEEVAKGRAKTLLEVYDENGKIKPIFYFILDKINKTNSYGKIVFDEVVILTNEKYYSQMVNACNNYKKETPNALNMTLFNDGSTCNENRLGANGGLKWLKDQMEIHGINYDEIMIIAGDNYFDFDLIEVVDYYETQKAQNVNPTVFVAKTFKDEELEDAKRGFAMLKTDHSNRIVEMVEKPLLSGVDVDSNMGAIALYLMPGENFELIDTFLEENKNDPKAKDALGYFGSYLMKNTLAYAWTWNGEFVDIGTVKAYNDLWADYEKLFGIEPQITF